MEIKTEYIQIAKSARYSTYGKLGAKTKYFWFLLHGSKMRCEQMLFKFSSFDPETHFVVAPEGLSRFYLNGFGGEVVSSWMTSRDRLLEIEDMSNYLSLLYQKFTAQLPVKTKKVIFGFSQGGTMMFRWLHQNLIEHDHLLAYSCWLPEDINLKESKSNLYSNLIHYTYGRQDQYLTQERMQALKDIVTSNDLFFQFSPYEGDHRVSRKQLELLYNLIDTSSVDH